MSCRQRQFTFLEDVLEVQADVLLSGLEQLRHLRLRQPRGFALELDFQTGFPVSRLVKDDLGIGFRFHSAALRHSETKNSGRLNSKWLTAKERKERKFLLRLDRGEGGEAG